MTANRTWRWAGGISALLVAIVIFIVPFLFIFLTASTEELLRRFAETRRKHPLSRGSANLHDSIVEERRLLDPIVNAADLILDTSRMGIHELRHAVTQRIEQRATGRMSILFQSFGYKRGIPGDADFVFN